MELATMSPWKQNCFGTGLTTIFGVNVTMDNQKKPMLLRPWLEAITVKMSLANKINVQYLAVPISYGEAMVSGSTQAWSLEDFVEIFNVSINSTTFNFFTIRIS